MEEDRVQKIDPNITAKWFLKNSIRLLNEGIKFLFQNNTAIAGYLFGEWAVIHTNTIFNTLIQNYFHYPVSKKKKNS